MALATVDHLRFSYTGGPSVLDDVTLEIAEGEHIALLGPSGCGKSTLLRALAGLVPHFHGGRFEGRVVVAGLDTRETRPAQLAGVVASVFQDPEDQVVMNNVANEIAFGLENIGVEPASIWPRVDEALASVGASHLADRATGELSGGELQRVSLASALALEPKLLLLDEPTSQLDPETADAFFDLIEQLHLRCAVLVSGSGDPRAPARSRRPAVLFMNDGRIALDSTREGALIWLAQHRPLYLPHAPDVVCRVRDVRFAYVDRMVLEGGSLVVRRGEVGCGADQQGSVGKTTLALITVPARAVRARRRARAPPTCRRIPAAISSRSGYSTRSRSARRLKLLVSRSRGSALRSTRSGIRAISPRANGNGSRSQRCLRRSLSSWCSMNPPVESTPSASRSSHTPAALH